MARCNSRYPRNGGVICQLDQDHATECSNGVIWWQPDLPCPVCSREFPVDHFCPHRWPKCVQCCSIDCWKGEEDDAA